MRFEFALRPLSQVSPWGRDRPTPHWFGLSDGWYWISVEGHEILRYQDEAVARWDLERPYPDYYVTRMWEDLILLRWALQEPVPDDLVPFVDGSFGRREFPDDDFGPAVDAAFDLQSDLTLDVGHLTDAPELRCWRRRDSVTLSQRIAPARRGTFAGPPRLEVEVPAAELFAAVDDFDRRFVGAMEERVAELERTGPPDGVDLNLKHLRAEHEQRRRWLELRLAQPRTVDWAAVRAGVEEIAAWPRYGAPRVGPE
ncbi:DUF5984 family protein [Actinoplanes sp. TRM 88003]|uniref:DUF5984 family protein n=1 Tax=Paractinoplanes aksuensis TaxID=2939490 RepID=A0ABT1DHC7_9ACTN|nr:DUF5984 family protein [Actinoplanes aksuensis]MCO8270234.1 DUF5984 family protein [Actinoplanes aksuensis]